MCVALVSVVAPTLNLERISKSPEDPLDTNPC